MDNESAKMTTSHGVLQGYNAQALVDSKHQVILAAEAFASQDHDNLKPMLDGAKKNLVTMGKSPDYFEGKEFTADSNYHSLNSLTVCKESSTPTSPISSSANAIRALPSRSASKEKTRTLVLSAPLIFLMMNTNTSTVVRMEKN